MAKAADAGVAVLDGVRVLALEVGGEGLVDLLGELAVLNARLRQALQDGLRLARGYLADRGLGRQPLLLLPRPEDELVQGAVRTAVLQGGLGDKRGDAELDELPQHRLAFFVLLGLLSVPVLA